MFQKFKDAIVKFLGLDNFYYERIVLTKDFLKQAISYAVESHPYECFGILQGKVRNKALYITSIHFEPHSSGKSSVTTRPIPYNQPRGWGTIHSHPSGGTGASRADLRTFSSNPVNIIIGYPYSSMHLSIYDQKGNRIGFEIEY